MIYFDNASSTKPDPAVVDEMCEFTSEYYAIPSSIFSHTLGLQVADKIQEARDYIAHKLGVSGNEIIFTSSGTKANNLAIKGYAFANKDKGKHIIASKIEHISVLETVKKLALSGFNVSYVGVDEKGFVDIDELRKAIRNDTILVSIQLANHEVGTIQNIEEIAKIVKEKGIILHVDAAIAVPYVPVDLSKCQIDMLTISPHKFYGPKGIGILFVRNGTKLEKLIDGGFNEFNIRAGHENTPAIIGAKKAFELWSENITDYLRDLKVYLYEKLMHEISDVQLNGTLDNSLPHILNVTFKYIEGESIALRLDFEGIGVTTGSACYSRNLQASHVLLSMGKSHEDSHGSIRFSLSKYNTKEEIDYTVVKLKEIVEDLRRISPLLGGN
ncbi:cysteine desulfurase family protein [Caldisericum exile]|uniref:Cysteine desulfurase n=1 Tax=Caldisericum exile (strain DSM 21853 / NBRC 104410 / AZM16c01) TaxID=511051 RepID=A0A7U6JF19_CALEA|nr:cysteine desulfurase family protein [Caldisericum exile]BAL81018.1 cysteine desulfurase [Caldisericum exile AZM16c01]